jgi:hypothetical protein
MIVSTLFFIDQILPKGEIYILKIKKLCDSGGSQSANVREKIVQITRFLYLVFSVQPKKYRRMIKDLYFIFGL